ncbi:MAG: PAS domain-containing sensor histidine kinase [Bacteroidia bacterium]
MILIFDWYFYIKWRIMDEQSVNATTNGLFDLGKDIGIEEQFSILLSSISDPVFIKNSESRLVLVNDGFCDMFSLKREECIGKTLAEHVPEHERESFLAIDRAVIETGIENLNEETLTVRDLGTRVISTRKSRFEDARGQRFLIGIIRDITDRVKAEEASIKHEKELEALNATKDKLFSIIAHDLRSPFSNIIGLSEFILDSINDIGEEDLNKFVSTINSSAKNSLDLLDNLLNWAKSQTGQLKNEFLTLNLSKVVELTQNQATAAAQLKRIELKNEVENDLTAHADENLLRTVIRNLISNALKFTREGGSIEITAKEFDTNIQICVKDTGIGIPKETLEKLFLKGHKTTTIGTNKEKGSGLGLVLCHDFVHQLNGELWVESEVGKGSSFYFTLPKGVV